MQRLVACIATALAVVLSACTQAAVSPTISSAPGTPPSATASEPAITSTRPTAAPSASHTTGPLTGEWDTGPYSTTDYGGTKWEVNLRFYDNNGVPFVLMTGWDPTTGRMPLNGDHGPYALLPDGQITIASADRPDIATLYSYKLEGNHLTVTWLKNSPNAPPGDVGGPFKTIHLTRRQ